MEKLDELVRWMVAHGEGECEIDFVQQERDALRRPLERERLRLELFSRIANNAEKGRGTILVQRRPGIAVVGSEERRPRVVRLGAVLSRTPRM